MALTTKQKYALKKILKELSTYRGRHTELVTVYVPVGYDLNKVIQQLAQEQGTASNIKSTSTRKNVTDALEKMIQHLRLYKRTPANGLACFSGNVAEREGQSDVKVWGIEPPEPLNQRIYRCDKTFVLDALQDMVDTKEVYGLVVLDRRDAMIALLKGKSIVPLQKTHSEVPGKMRAGGQSAMRFSRLREGAIIEHYKKVAEYMKEQFLPMKGLKGIIIGGPGVTINDFVNRGYITADVQKKILGTKDLSYTEEFGLQELVDKSQDLLAAEEIAAEKQIMEKFFHLLATRQGMVAYGEVEVMNKLKMGIVETVLLSEDLSEDTMERFEKEADAAGSESRVISTETREGAQLRDLGKIAAILRYEA